jgi:hypothetical protein
MPQSRARRYLLPAHYGYAQALQFDEWLVDVALDRIGKSIAIMLAITLIDLRVNREN